MKLRIVEINKLNLSGDVVISYSVERRHCFKWKPLATFKFEDQAVRLLKELSKRKSVIIKTIKETSK